MGEMFVLRVGERSMATSPGLVSQLLLLEDLVLLFEPQVSLAIAMLLPFQICNLSNLFRDRAHRVVRLDTASLMTSRNLKSGSLGRKNTA